jgi:hypothetical protein
MQNTNNLKMKTMRQFLIHHCLIPRLILIALLGFHCNLTCAQTATAPVAADSSAPTASAAPVTSSAASEPLETAKIISANERDNMLLAQALPNEIQWLETPNGKILSLYKARETTQKKGSLLLLHATDLSWPAAFDNLRRNLPVYGWDTLALPLPAQYPTLASAAATPPRAQVIAERVNAAIKQLNQNGQFNIVVIVDNSSAPDALAELYKSAPQALVLVNVEAQEPLTETQLTAIFSQATLPMVDVFFAVDDKRQRELRRTHQAAAMRNNVKDYQQLTLPPEHAAATFNPQNFWLEKIRGFMEKKAKGTEIKK